MENCVKTLKWETMKQKAKEQFWNVTNSNGGVFPNSSAFLAQLEAALEVPKRKPREVLKEWQDKGTEIIDKWDIRCCMKLAKCFPSCLPKNTPLNSIPTIGQDEKDDWVVIFN
jgi:hypothetical protein